IMFMMVTGAATEQLTTRLDVEVVASGNDVLPLNGDAGNVEFDGVAVKPDESVAYVFDSVSSFDGIFALHTDSAVFATESQLTGGGTSASAGDMDADSNNLYTSVYDGTRQHILRIPHGGIAGA